MNRLFKNSVPLLLGALSITAPILADMDVRLVKLESQMRDVYVQTARDNHGATTTTANPSYDGFGFFAEGDALFWHLFAGDSEYAMHTLNQSPTYNAQGQVLDTKFNWDWGFRVKTGYFAEHDQWDSNLAFTWFQTAARNSKTADSNSSIEACVGNPDFVSGNANSVSNKYNVDYYDLTWEIGRNFFVSKYLALRPFVGVRSSWFYDNWDTTFFKLLSNQQYTAKNKNDFVGIGPRIGFDSTFYFSNHLSLFGSVSGALLWAKYNVTAKTYNETSGTVLNDNLTSLVHSVSPNLQFQLGVGYNRNICDDAYNISFQVAYDSLYYFNENQMLDFYVDFAQRNARTSHSESAKMMQGFSAGLTFAF